MKIEDDLYRGIPHKYTDGDKSGRLSSEEVKALAKQLLKKGLNELKQKYIRESMKTIYRGSEEYPKSFEDLGDNAPTALYGLGNTELLRQGRRIAVIGSRDVSEEGYKTAYQYAKLQAMQGNVIVSGLALGCDTAAHKGALDAGGLTIAIVGSGLDYCHPIENKKLMNEIIQKEGLILTEYELGIPATPYAGYSFDHGWYKAHGYVEAKEVFRRIEEKYKNITPEQARELLRTGAYKRKLSN